MSLNLPACFRECALAVAASLGEVIVDEDALNKWPVFAPTSWREWPVKGREQLIGTNFLLFNVCFAVAQYNVNFTMIGHLPPSLFRLSMAMINLVSVNLSTDLLCDGNDYLVSVFI